ncbi:MAG: hypothetical protein INR64_04275 [Caulobacteraceae bacterium]|nr:hypothetical protein [Caulobacter sp.]
MAAAAFAMAVAGAAHADPLRPQTPPTPNFVSAADGQDLSKPWSVPTAHKTLQLDAKGRWGVRLDMEQPSGRSSDWKDVEAGAYLRLTPRLRVGGSVGLGDKFADPQRLTPEDTAPRVHLETAFKF